MEGWRQGGAAQLSSEELTEPEERKTVLTHTGLLMEGLCGLLLLPHRRANFLHGSHNRIRVLTRNVVAAIFHDNLLAIG